MNGRSLEIRISISKETREDTSDTPAYSGMGKGHSAYKYSVGGGFGGGGGPVAAYRYQKSYFSQGE